MLFSHSLAVGLNWRREQIAGYADPNGRVTDPTTGLELTFARLH